MKHGNIRLLSIGSFFIPLVSTALLLLFSRAEAEGNILIATALIFLSAIIGAQDKIRENLIGLIAKNK